MRQSRVLQKIGANGDRLNNGHTMNLGCQGIVVRPQNRRLRTPWVKGSLGAPRRVLLNKDKAILEGQTIPVDGEIERMAMADPLDVLKGAVAQYQYSTSTGKNIFQLASQVPYDGRGQKIYRKEWQEGTFEKHITITAVEYDRSGVSGKVYGYITFHGETTLVPVEINQSEVPGWFMEYEEKNAVPYDENVPAPPSIGTEVPVDPTQYRLKSYPFYDPPNPTEYVDQLLKYRGVLPDVEEPDAPEEGAEDDSNDGSEHVESK